MNDLLSVKQVAARLKLRDDTIRAWARQGRLPSIKLGARVVRFDPKEVDRFVRAGKND